MKKTIASAVAILLFIACQKEVTQQQVRSTQSEAAIALTDTVYFDNAGDSRTDIMAGMYQNLWTTNVASYQISNTDNLDTLTMTKWKLHKYGKIAWTDARLIEWRADGHTRQRIDIRRDANGSMIAFTKNMYISNPQTSIELDIFVRDYPKTQHNTFMTFDLDSAVVIRNGINRPIKITNKFNRTVKFY